MKRKSIFLSLIVIILIADAATENLRIPLPKVIAPFLNQIIPT